MDPCELTVMITAAANAIAADLNNDELTLLAAVLTQLADTLNTIAAGRNMCNDTDNE